MRDPEGNKREIIAGEGDGRGKWDRKREKERKKEWEVVFGMWPGWEIETRIFRKS